MKLSAIVPGKDQRAAVIGMSGSGKSHLSKKLLSHCGTNIVVIDPKNQFDLPGATIVDTPAKFKKARKMPITFRPHPKDLMNQSLYDEILEFCYERGDLTVYIDDLVGIVTPTKYPHYLGVCYMMGRSHNLRMISAFQRPSRLPLFVMSEALRFYCFRLNLKDDVKRIQEFVPGYDPAKLTIEHSFFYYNVLGHEPAKELIL